MNGIESIEEHWKSKESKLKKSYTTKLFLFLLFSNTIIYFSSSTKEVMTNPIPNDWFPLVNKENRKIIISTKNYLDTNLIKAPKLVTIMTDQNKVIIRKAWLHSVYSVEERSNLFTNSRIEISENDLAKLSTEREHSLKLFPFYKSTKNKNPSRRNTYELIF
jgi:hypothetical protein